MKQGQTLAYRGKPDEAVPLFGQALKYDLELGIELAKSTREEATRCLVEQGQALAYEGKLDEAISLFEQALKYDPDLGFEPAKKTREEAAKGLLEPGETLAQNGNIQKALAAYADAQSLYKHVDISAEERGLVAEVLDACEQVVLLAPEKGSIRDSRGLARALTSDFDGAIEDFQFFVDRTDNKEQKTQRQHWIEALQAGENPFTPELLEQLRKE